MKVKKHPEEGITRCEMAEMLGIKYKTLWKKIRELEIDVPQRSRLYKKHQQRIIDALNQ